MRKKILAIITAAIILTITVMPVCAETLSATGSQDVPLTYSVTQAFTVTIPASIDMGTGKTKTDTVSVTGALLPFAKTLNVKMGSTNYSTGFRMKNGTNDAYLSYTVSNQNDGAGTATPITDNNATILSVAAGTATGGTTLTFTAGDTNVSGSYSDTLTFAVSVD